MLIIIPAYNPPDSFLGLAEELLQNDVKLIIVDDGSSSNYKSLFEQLSLKSGTYLLSHATNQGKGAALKTAFQFALERFPDVPGVTTADADGQHLPVDILSVARCLHADPSGLYIGTRRFTDPLVPWTNKFGNTLTRKLFRLLFRCALSDTQSGLRGIPSFLMRHLNRLPSTGYEFEMEMLIFVRQNRVPILTVPISVIYRDKNRTSHFDQVGDSYRIYSVLLRFFLITVSITVLDVIVFLNLVSRFGSLEVAQLLSRLFTLTLNYCLVQRFVFRSNVPQRQIIPVYVLMAIFLSLMSYSTMCLLIYQFAIEPGSAKILSESLTFIPFFVFQRDVIFRQKLIKQ